MHQGQEMTGPGIVVLSTSLQVLHMNRRAVDMLTRVNQAALRPTPAQVLAAPLHQTCQNLIEAMQARLESENCEPLHQFRVIGDPGHTMLLKGFALPDARGLLHSRIVVLLSLHTPISNRDAGTAEPAQEIAERSHLVQDASNAINN